MIANESDDATGAGAVNLETGTSIAVVIATLILAGVTVFLGIQARNSALAAKEQTSLSKDQGTILEKELQATQDQAKAAADQAKLGHDTLEEIRFDREARGRPYLVVRRVRISPEEAIGFGVGKWFPGSALMEVDRELGIDVCIENVGRGPALDVLVTEADGASFRWALEPQAVAPGKEIEVNLSPHLDDGRYRGQPPNLFMVKRGDGTVLNTSAFSSFVMVCRDETGSRLYRFALGCPGDSEWDVAGETPQQPGWVTDLKSLAPWLYPGG